MHPCFSVSVITLLLSCTRGLNSGHLAYYVPFLLLRNTQEQYVRTESLLLWNREVYVPELTHDSYLFLDNFLVNFLFTRTKYLAPAIQRRKGLFWLISVHGLLAQRKKHHRHSLWCMDQWKPRTMGPRHMGTHDSLAHRLTHSGDPEQLDTRHVGAHRPLDGRVTGETSTVQVSDIRSQQSGTGELHQQMSCPGSQIQRQR